MARTMNSVAAKPKNSLPGRLPEHEFTEVLSDLVSALECGDFDKTKQYCDRLQLLFREEKKKWEAKN